MWYRVAHESKGARERWAASRLDRERPKKTPASIFRTIAGVGGEVYQAAPEEVEGIDRGSGLQGRSDLRRRDRSRVCSRITNAIGVRGTGPHFLHPNCRTTTNCGLRIAHMVGETLEWQSGCALRVPSSVLGTEDLSIYNCRPLALDRYSGQVAHEACVKLIHRSYCGTDASG
jgi:hypothetical protein